MYDLISDNPKGEQAESAPYSLPLGIAIIALVIFVEPYLRPYLESWIISALEFLRTY